LNVTLPIVAYCVEMPTSSSRFDSKPTVCFHVSVVPNSLEKLELASTATSACADGVPNASRATVMVSALIIFMIMAPNDTRIVVCTATASMTKSHVRDG
jgi:hypothetical protein